VLSKGSFKYSGKPIRIGHARLFDKGLNEQHFDMVVGHLVAAMNDIGLPTDIINDINAVVFPLRPIFEEEGKKRMVKQ
jgi:hemoglobin